MHGRLSVHSHVTFFCNWSSLLIPSAYGLSLILANCTGLQLARSHYTLRMCSRTHVLRTDLRTQTRLHPLHFKLELSANLFKGRRSLTLALGGAQASPLINRDVILQFNLCPGRVSRVMFSGKPWHPLSALQLLPEVILSLRGLRSPHCSWLLQWSTARKAGRAPGQAAGLPRAQHAQALSDLLLRSAWLLPASGRLLRMLLLQLQPERCHVPRGCWVGGLHWLWSWLWDACSASSL